ncbi:alpha/beta hydrolase [Arthrobacter sp. 31Y]|uniref:alpha/beta hydrolase n=1 Tax=Arthrobacter sp. 31Y TaxID=1115632 RepID=UPI00046554BE|nr:alpha/beta hydrolase [Arthrobacter sp. 31Y]
MTLDPEIRKILEKGYCWDAEHGPPDTIEEARARVEILRADIWKPQMLPVGSIENRAMNGSGGPLDLRIYRPSKSGIRPTVVYLHGGAWSAGSLDSHESHARRLCNRTGAVIVAVDYRLAPEDRFPAGYEDCAAAHRWVVEHIAELGGDPSRIAIGGDSAGGNLAAAVALEARDQGVPLAAQLLIYPATDLSAVYPSMRQLATGYFLELDPDAQQGQGYVSSPSELSDRRVSPLLADLKGVAPAVVIVAEYDPLKDQGAVYAEKLKASGVKVIYRNFSGLIHSFMSMGASPAAVDASDTLCADLAGLLGVAANHYTLEGTP